MKSIIVVLLLSLQAQASVQYDQFYTDAKGTRIEAASAILSAVKGDQVYKCQSVEYKLSKSGTSIGIHNLKKPKVTKN